MARYGRTWRRRRKKLTQKQTLSQCGLIGTTSEIAMRKWMKKKFGYRPYCLKPVFFADTGRGLMTLKKLCWGDLILSIPKGLLITTHTVMESDLGAHLKRWKTKFCGTQVLSLFLAYEFISGLKSEWHPYIDMLPGSYTNAAYWSENELNSLPSYLIPKAKEQIQQLNKSYEEVQEFCKFYDGIRQWCMSGLGNNPAQVQSLCCDTDSAKCERTKNENASGDMNIEDYGVGPCALSDTPNQCGNPKFKGCSPQAVTPDLYRWAWSSVNTRCVYMQQTCNPWIRNPEQDRMALAPFLDLLNHSAQVQVKAGLNEASGCYEIRSETPTSKNNQVFISYGPHDNGRLLLEYGFIVPNNQHNTVSVEMDHILAVYERLRWKNVNNKMQLITDNDLQKGLLLSVEGLSWNLEITLRILALDACEMTRVRRVMGGGVFSDDNERMKTQLAHSIMDDMVQELQGKIQVDPVVLNEKQRMARSLCQEYLDIIHHCRELLIH